MPVMKKDEYSGAILFVRTPEEKRSDAMEERVKTLENIILQLSEDRGKTIELKETIKKK